MIWRFQRWESKLFCLCPIIAEKTQRSPCLTARYTEQRAWIGETLWSDDLAEAMSAHESVLKRSTVKRQALQLERGLNSRHVLIKKELWVLAASPPASLVSTQRPPSPPPQDWAQKVSTQIRTGDQGMRAGEEWVAGGLVGWRAGRKGGGCMWWELRRWEGGVFQFRRPLWGLENSVIVPAEMQHQQWTRCCFVTLWAQTRDRALSPEPFFNTSSIGVTGLNIRDNVNDFIKLHWKLYVLRINSMFQNSARFQQNAINCPFLSGQGKPVSILMRLALLCQVPFFSLDYNKHSPICLSTSCKVWCG